MNNQEKYKYKIIENYIYERIRNGIYAVDSLLPTHEWFCKEFNISRTTVNKAFEALVENGFIEKIQGSGCYVRTPKLSQQSIYMSSFSEEYSKKGYQVSTNLIFYTIKQISDFRDPKLSKRLGALPKDYVHYFERVRFGNEKPFAVQYSYITKDIIPTIPISCLKNSIYSYIENNLNLAIGDGNSQLSVMLPPDDIALLLRIPKTEPVVYVSHISRFTNSVVFEYTESFIKYDHFSILYSNKR